jgi:hypothetical protein
VKRAGGGWWVVGAEELRRKSHNSSSESHIQVVRKRLYPFFIFKYILDICRVPKGAHIESLYGRKNFDLLPNFWYIKDNITSGAQRKIFEKGTIFFGHPAFYTLRRSVRAVGAEIPLVPLSVKFKEAILLRKFIETVFWDHKYVLFVELPDIGDTAYCEAIG